MQAAVRNDYIAVQDYLASEDISEVRHEYLGGLVYAMAGETRSHNTIALNTATLLRQHLKSPCKVYMSGVRVNFRIREDEYYYYPDVVVTCDRRERDPLFVRYPKLIVEILSESTERIDRGEKFFAYTTLESLEEYVLLSQTAPEITIFRRANDWHPQTFCGAESVIQLKAIDLKLPLSALYEGI